MGITEELRHAAAKLVNGGKFAFGSTVSQVGLQVYDVVGASKGDVKKNNVMVEEMNNRQQQQQQTRNGDVVEGGDNLKRLFDEPLNPHRKIFIRSRL